jgi:hypothetical protein
MIDPHDARDRERLAGGESVAGLRRHRLR